LGAVTGALVVAATRFAPAGERGAVRASGSVITVAIWMAALALRLGARYAFAGLGATAAVQFELNIGLLTLVSAAFVVVAVAFRRAIVRFAPT
ncbi:MAG: hypothetical protein JOZ24_11245, partial [Candidatus Eremiobacteraeota bacterium]|nr:hypothetical protein [Candidatus Eremiobacteraeota bacterium]